MQTDWIKMRTELYRDPKVCVIADLLLDDDSDLARYVSQNHQCDMAITRNVMRNAVVGALVSVWGVMRQRGRKHGTKLFCPTVTLFAVDDIADLPGFGEAMAFVGWIIETDDGLVFPGFFAENNVDPQATRSQAAVRQQRFRDKKKVTERNGEVTPESNVTRDVTNNVTSRPREEKRREEKSFTAKSKSTSKAVPPRAEKSGSRARELDADPNSGARESEGQLSQNVEESPAAESTAMALHVAAHAARPLPKGVTAVGGVLDAVAAGIEACRAIRAGGVMPVGVNDARLQEALRAGVTPAQLGEVAAEAVRHDPPKGYGWVVATAQGRARDAVALPVGGQRRPSLCERVIANSMRAAAAREAAETAFDAFPDGIPYEPH